MTWLEIRSVSWSSQLAFRSKVRSRSFRSLADREPRGVELEKLSTL
jgi:hypothetical protein